MSVLEKKIGSVVEENFVYARALFHLGIDFFLDEHRSLDEVCRERGISRQQVIKCFYEFDNASKCSFDELSTYPIDLLLAYLKHSHHLFIKDKLPYISYLLRNHQMAVLDDLKEIFPVFVEDFIKHIYEEEDELFDYVLTLHKIEARSIKNPAARLLPYRNISLEKMQSDHDNEDEMGNLREMIEAVTTSDLHTKVIVDEIKAFDREILYHAEIENEILFPRAIDLQEKVKVQLQKLSKLN